MLKNMYASMVNRKTLSPLTPTVVIWVQLLSILCQTGLSRHLFFWHLGTDTQGWASECPDVKNYKWRLNPVWHMMLYCCTRMATVSIKGLTYVCSLFCGVNRNVKLSDVNVDTTHCIGNINLCIRH